jgi:hypothetical protein
MSMRRVRRPVSVAAEAVIPVGADATNSLPDRRNLFLGASAAFLVAAALIVVGAFPILSRTDEPPVPANSTLKCYDNEGKDQPCLTPASASPSPSPSKFAGRSTEEPARWTTTALYQAARYQGEDHLVNWVDEPPANLTTTAPMARHSATPVKHSASSHCARHLLPCFFSAVKRGLTHMASVAGTVGSARSTRGPL